MYTLPIYSSTVVVFKGSYFAEAPEINGLFFQIFSLEQG